LGLQNPIRFVQLEGRVPDSKKEPTILPSLVTLMSLAACYLMAC